MRETRPNATVTTLLDMFLKANPDRDRTEQEKAEIAKKYRPGEPVLVQESAVDGENDSEDEEEEEERRLLEAVREMSLRDVGVVQESPGRSRSTDNRTRADTERRARRRMQQQSARDAAPSGGTVGRGDPERRVEHQSSLRSLLSASDVETTTQEEIVRLIMDEGLLDGIDLASLDQAQEEELSDRLVQIFLSRHPSRSYLRRQSSERSQRRMTEQTQHRRVRSHSHVPSRSGSSSPMEAESSRHPPTSRPHLLDVPPTPGHQRRASDQDGRRRRASPTPVTQASTSETSLETTVRRSGEIAHRHARDSPTRSRATTSSSSASAIRRATEPHGRISDTWQNAGREREESAARQIVSSTTESPAPSTPVERSRNIESAPPSPRHPPAAARVEPRRHHARRHSAYYVEPFISCNRCGKSGIQYELHQRCLRCREGQYYLCLRCYRTGKGCLHWFGFGAQAMFNFEQKKQSSPTAMEPPHILSSQRYRRPPEGASKGIVDGKHITTDNPAGRLEQGTFCDICHSLSNDCLWQCDICNDGEWGYCQRCVNQGRSCTHPLVSVRRVVPAGSDVTSALDAQFVPFSTSCDLCRNAIPPAATRFHCPQCNDGDYDVCTNCYLKLVASGKIAKENGHNGWRRCLRGHRMIVVGFEDYGNFKRRVIVRDLVGGHTFRDDLLTRSNSGGLLPEHATVVGDWSWTEGSTRRRKTSRMRNVVAATTTTAAASAASSSGISSSSPSSTSGSPIVSSDDGHVASTSPASSTSAATSARRFLFPPDGGVGLVLQALWSYYPEEDVHDELGFPRGAEITEAENINDEWYWGYYAGSTGLFPGAYCRVIREVV